MEKTKEQFQEMREREWSIIMTDEAFKALPSIIREGYFKIVRAYYPDEHRDLYDADERYRAIYGNYSKAKKALDEYKFERRYPNEPL